MMRQETDEALCKATLANKIPPLLDYLEKEIGTQESFVGNRFTIADVSVATMLVNFSHAGETVDAQRWPKLAAYAPRIHERPSFKALIQKEQPIVQRFRAA